MKLIFKKIIRIFSDKEHRYNFLNARGFSRFISSEKLLKIRYYARFGQELNLNAPTKYTEKLQWLKVYDQNPDYTLMVDKYEAKKLVAEKIGEEYVESYDGKYAHLKCCELFLISEVLEFLDVEVRKMEEEN